MPASPSTTAVGNRILAGLPPAERRRLGADAEVVDWTAGEVLCDFGAPLRSVYFPRRGLVSLFARVEERRSIGVGFVRSDGVFGLVGTGGRARSRLRAVAQSAGGGERIEMGAFRRLLGTCPGLANASLAYAGAATEQVAQNVVCTAFHSARQRIARWLLDVSAGSGGDALLVTQATIADSLGLQRPSVSRVTSVLQREGLLSYVRGRVTVRDRRALRVVACGCTAGPVRLR